MIDHSHRELIAGELHARPYIALDPSLQIPNLALVHDDDNGSASREHHPGQHLTPHACRPGVLSRLLS